MQLVIIAIGSNLGDARANVLRAMERLEKLSAKLVRRSSLWRTTPIDCPPGSPPFINAVVALVPRKGETPESMLRRLQALEKEFGRGRKSVQNEPRPLDLDLIAFGSERRRTKKLVLPHPRAHLRRFVLEPLAEFAAEAVLHRRKTVVQLLAELPKTGTRRVADQS